MGGERETGPVDDDAHSPKGAALHPRNILLRMCHALPSRRARPPASTPPSLSSAHLPFKPARLPWARVRSTFHPHSVSSTMRRLCLPSSPPSSSPSSQVRSFLLSLSLSLVCPGLTRTPLFFRHLLALVADQHGPREDDRPRWSRGSRQDGHLCSCSFASSFLNALPFRPYTSHPA